jgi:hypothetical protein
VRANNDREAFKIVFEDDVFDESLFATGVEITSAQWGAPAVRNDSTFSMAIKRR